MFVIWESQQPPVPRWLRLDPVSALQIFASGYMAMVLAMWVWGRRVATGAFRGQTWRGFDRFNRGMTVARLFIPAWFAVGVFYLGWRPLVDHLLWPLHRLPLKAPEYCDRHSAGVSRLGGVVVVAVRGRSVGPGSKTCWPRSRPICRFSPRRISVTTSSTSCGRRYCSR